MPAPRCLAHAAMIFVTATFSLWNVLGDVVLKRGIDPIVLATYRELGTALLLGLAVSCMRRRAAVPRPDNHQMWLFAACGWAGVYGLQLFYILGLQHTSADTAALFQPLTPVLVVVISAVLGIERLTLRPCGSAMARRGWQKLVGVALACGGCALIVGCKGGGGGGGDASGGGGGGESSGPNHPSRRECGRHHAGVVNHAAGATSATKADARGRLATTSGSRAADESYASVTEKATVIGASTGGGTQRAARTLRKVAASTSSPNRQTKAAPVGAKLRPTAVTGASAPPPSGP